MDFSTVRCVPSVALASLREPFVSSRFQAFRPLDLPQPAIDEQFDSCYVAGIV